MKSGKIRGFTLTELLIGMVLFSIVMAVSGAAISVTMNLLYKQTGRTLSSAYAENTCKIIKEKLRFGTNVEITASLNSNRALYNRYFDGDKDIVFYVSSKTSGTETQKIYLVSSVAGGTVIKEPLFEMDSMDMTLKCTPNTKRQSARFDLTVTEKTGKKSAVFTKSFAARRLNTDKGGMTFSFTSARDRDYYIFIDND